MCSLTLILRVLTDMETQIRKAKLNACNRTAAHYARYVRTYIRVRAHMYLQYIENAKLPHRQLHVKLVASCMSILL